MITACMNQNISTPARAHDAGLEDTFLTPGYLPSGMHDEFRSTTFFRLVGLPSRVRRVGRAA